MADDIQQYFNMLRRPVFVEDPNAVPQEVGSRGGNIAPSGWLEDNSVSSDVIQANAVIAEKVSAGAITTDKLAANAVTAAKIAAGTITATEIASGAISTDKLAANAVTAAKIAADTITANQIAASAITASELATNAVTTAKILAGNVTSDRMEVTISGKRFGANDGSAGSPGYYFGSGTNYGLYYVTSVPFFGAVIALATNGGASAYWSTIANASGSKFIPMTDNAVSLGDSTHRWTTVYATNGTINTSDASIKKDIQDSPLGLGFINTLRPRAYRWRDTDDTQAREAAEAAFDPEALRVETAPWRARIESAFARLQTLRADHPDVARLKGVIALSQQKIAEADERHTRAIREAKQARRPGRRLHYGLIAQEVKEALDEAGVDAAFWQESPDGLQSLAYSELISPLIRAVQELSARVQALEGQS